MAFLLGLRGGGRGGIPPSIQSHVLSWLKWLVQPQTHVRQTWYNLQRRTQAEAQVSHRVARYLGRCSPHAPERQSYLVYWIFYKSRPFPANGPRQLFCTQGWSLKSPRLMNCHVNRGNSYDYQFVIHELDVTYF